MHQESSNSYLVPMLEKSMGLLEILAKHHNGLTIQEISTKSGYSKTTVFRIMTTLLELGYLGKAADCNCFFISRKLFRLGISALGEINIVERSIEPMTRLRDQVKESVMLGALVGNRVVLLEQILGSHNFTFNLKSGTNICLHASAPGKVLLAALPDSRKTELLEDIEFTKFNDNTITDMNTFLEELTKTAEQGYGVDIEEEIEGVYCIGAPIFNYCGDPVAAVWITAPKGRLPLQHFDSVALTIIECADQISSKCGFKVIR